MPSQTSMICLIDPDSVVPAGHPIRSIKKLADGALKQLSNDFDRVYHSNGRHSIPPERLLKGMLLMALFSIKSERALCEQLHYNLLFKWFVDMEMTEKVFDPSVFSRNRERFQSAELTARFFDEVVAKAQRKQLMSRDHVWVRRDPSCFDVALGGQLESGEKVPDFCGGLRLGRGRVTAGAVSRPSAKGG